MLETCWRFNRTGLHGFQLFFVPMARSDRLHRFVHPPDLIAYTHWFIRNDLTELSCHRGQSSIDKWSVIHNTDAWNIIKTTKSRQNKLWTFPRLLVFWDCKLLVSGCGSSKTRLMFSWQRIILYSDWLMHNSLANQTSRGLNPQNPNRFHTKKTFALREQKTYSWEINRFLATILEFIERKFHILFNL